MTSDELKFLRVGDVIDSPVGLGIVTSYEAGYGRNLESPHESLEISGDAGTQVSADVCVTFFSSDVPRMFTWWMYDNGGVGVAVYPFGFDRLSRLPEPSDFIVEMHKCSVYHKV